MTEATATWVRSAQTGDTAAFAELVRAFLRAAYAVALAVVRRPADAEDIAQDAFVIAFDRIATCREPERFAGWLMQIVRNRARNWLDARRLRDVAPDADAAERAEDFAEASGVRPEIIGIKERLVAALGAVSETQREVVLLHDLQEWTHAEIAEAIGISEGMSRQHLFNARRILRMRLEDDAYKEKES